MAALLPWPYQGAAWEALLDDLATRLAFRVAELLSTADPKGSEVGDLMTAPEACALLSISRSSLDRLTRQGQVRMIKVGASNRYPRASLTDYLQGASRTAA